MGKWFKMAGVLKGNQADFVRLKAQKVLSQNPKVLWNV